MKFTQRELQVVAGAPSVRQVEDGATFLPVTGTLSKCPGQFLEAGERLSYGFEKGGHQLAITRKGSRDDGLPITCRRADRSPRGGHLLAAFGGNADLSSS